MGPRSRWWPIRSRALPRLISCLAALWLLLPAPSAGAEVRATDDRGREIVLAQPARRVVSLYSAFNEMLAAMGLLDRVAARTKADEYPPAILAKPSVGTHMRPNVEMVLALAPDLVLQMEGRSEAMLAVDQLEKSGVAVAVFKPESLEDVYSVIRRLGLLLGEPRRAETLEHTMRSRVRAVQDRLRETAQRPTVFVEMRHPNLLAAGRGSLADEVVRLAGGVNRVPQDKKLVRLGEEALLGLDPDVYVVLRGPMNPDPAPLAQRPLYATLRAARLGRVLLADQAVYSRPGPRLVEAVEELAGFLHPGLWSKQP